MDSIKKSPNKRKTVIDNGKIRNDLAKIWEKEQSKDKKLKDQERIKTDKMYYEWINHNKQSFAYKDEINHIDERGFDGNSNFLKNLYNNKYFIIYSFVVYFIALLANDLNQMFFNKKADIFFDILTILVLIFFIAELFLSLLYLEDYSLGFHFWLDFSATISMIMELSWVLNPIVDSLTIQHNITNFSIYNYERSLKSQRIVVSRSVLRIIRLIRIAKIYKMYRFWEDVIDLELIKNKSEKRQKINIDENNNEDNDIDNDDKKMSDEEKSCKLYFKK